MTKGKGVNRSLTGDLGIGFETDHEKLQQIPEALRLVIGNVKQHPYNLNSA